MIKNLISKRQIISKSRFKFTKSPKNSSYFNHQNKIINNLKKKENKSPFQYQNLSHNEKQIPLLKNQTTKIILIQPQNNFCKSKLKNQKKPLFNSQNILKNEKALFSTISNVKTDLKTKDNIKIKKEDNKIKKDEIKKEIIKPFEINLNKKYETRDSEEQDLKRELISFISKLKNKEENQISEDDFYNFSSKHLKKENEIELLKQIRARYPGLSNAIIDLFPEFNWLEWKFPQTRKGFFKDIQNQRKYLEWLTEKKNFNNLEDYYNLQTSDFLKNHGRTLLKEYGGNLKNLLENLFPHFHFFPWKFENGRVPKEYWKNEENVKKVLTEIENFLEIKNLDDWQKVGIRQLESMGLGGLLKHYGGLKRLLERFYNNSSFDEEFQKKNYFVSRKSQTYLETLLKKLFPNEQMSTNFIHPNLRFPNSQRNIELDIFFENLKLAFEFQGAHHYKNTFINSNFEIQKERDSMKEKLCMENNITLIQIPYWWDYKESSLKATIYNLRPELLEKPTSGNPINLSVPSPKTTMKKFNIINEEIKKQKMKKEEGENKSERSPLMLAKSLIEFQSFDPKGWFISIKFDGVRAFYEDKTFFTRNFKQIKVDPSILNHIPDVDFSLDGELYLKVKRKDLYQADPRYGNWTTIQNSLKKGEIETDLYQIQYLVFDTLDFEAPFSERYRFLKQNLPSSNNSFCQLIPHFLIKDDTFLQKFREKCRQIQAEGAILRNPDAFYESGRSSSILKVKDWMDTEAKVIESNSKSILCQMKSGHLFKMSLNVGRFKNIHIPINSTVTFKHAGISPVTGLPIQPALLGIREDLD